MASRGSCSPWSCASTSTLRAAPGRILRNACSSWKAQATTSASSPGSNGLWRSGASLNSGGRSLRFATEQQNPGNAKHVTRITITITASRLASGVSFVDTPGLGSLATSGAAETLAYLPKCDLGVVLIDAGSTLTEEDVRTIRALQEAAIPAHILLSKTDLLDRPDCEKT